MTMVPSVLALMSVRYLMSELSLSFIFFGLLRVDGTGLTDVWKEIEQSLPTVQPFPSPHFPRCMMFKVVCSGATMKRDESLECFSQ